MQINKVLPLFDKPFYSYNFTIDSKDYRFTFRYSKRTDSYKMDIRNANGNILIRGVKLVTGVSLLRQYVIEAFEGDFVLIPKKRSKIYEWGVEDGRRVFSTHSLAYVLPDE